MQSSTVVILLSISGILNFHRVFAASSRHRHDHHHPKTVKDNDEVHDEKNMEKKLSPWELHMLSDLYMELSLLRCPSINRFTARDLKTFIEKRVSSPSGNEVAMMDAQFLTVYQNLVRCLEHLDTQAHVPHKNGKSKDAEIVDSQAKKEDKEIQLKMKRLVPKKRIPLPAGKVAVGSAAAAAPQLVDKVADSSAAKSIPLFDEQGYSNSILESSETMETKTKTIMQSHPKPSSSSSSSHPAKHLSLLTRTWNWIRKLFSHRRQASKSQKRIEETAPVLAAASPTSPASSALAVSPARAKREIQSVEKHPKAAADHVKKLTELAHKDFVLMLEMLSGIVINACPAEIRLSSSFAAKSVIDIARSVAKDGPSMIDAVNSYFVKNHLWEQVRDCVIETANSNKKMSENNSNHKPPNVDP